jgi:hypothetical protein
LNWTYEKEHGQVDFNTSAEIIEPEVMHRDDEQEVVNSAEDDELADVVSQLTDSVCGEVLQNELSKDSDAAESGISEEEVQRRLSAKSDVILIDGFMQSLKEEVFTAWS